MAHSERLKKAIAILEDIQEEFLFLEIALRLLKSSNGEDVSIIKEASFLVEHFVEKQDALKKLKSAIDELDTASKLYDLGRRD